MKKTAIIIAIIAIIGIAFLTGCITDTTDGDNDVTENSVTADNVIAELDENLVDEDSIVEIGDMV